jgi:hypothetical protein
MVSLSGLEDFPKHACPERTYRLQLSYRGTAWATADSAEETRPLRRLSQMCRAISARAGRLRMALLCLI